MSGADQVVLPDEDAFTLPGVWRRRIIPRRGTPAGPRVTLSPAAAPSVPESQGFVQMLDRADSDPELVTAARQALTDLDQATPLGAAVLLAGLIHFDGKRLPACSAELDYWTASRGAAFAARMVVELPDLLLIGSYSRGLTLLRRSRHPVRDPFTIGDDRIEQLMHRLRAYLAQVSDQEYAEACDAVADCRERDLSTQVVVSFLFPTRTDWVEAACEALAAAPHSEFARLLWCAAGSASQLQQLAEHLSHWVLLNRIEMFATGLDGVAPAIAPILISWLDKTGPADKEGDRLLAALSRIPTDEAMRGLVARLDQPRAQSAFLKAQKRFPVRALRVLAEAVANETPAGQPADPLLRAQVTEQPELVAAALPLLSPAAAAYLEKVTVELDGSPDTAAPDLPFASPASLPPALVTPPWIEQQPTVLKLTPPEETELVWQPGEREDWLTHGHQDDRQRWEQHAAEYHAGTLHPYYEPDFFINAPDDLPREWVTSWRPSLPDLPGRWLPRFVARYERDALPVLMQVASKDPLGAAPFLMPFANVEIATRMADWLNRTEELRWAARDWLHRHPAFAARALICAALGRPGRRRGAAEQALRTLAETHRDEILAAAKEYGPEALTEVGSLLDHGPLLPARIPTLPAWADPALLPPVWLRNQTGALPPEAVRHLCTMLALSTMDQAYAEVLVVKEACDPASLAEFGWALFEQWRSVGMPSKERWAFTCLAWVGDDQTVQRLAPLIRAWPGKGGNSRAVTGLDVLATIGTEDALRQLLDISRRVKFKALRRRATEKVAEVAAGLGLSIAQLEDRLVPDLGLDERGSLTLDYGKRQFTVGFDEQLKPYVLDDTGARRRTLPRPGSGDDTQLAPAAYQRFGNLKKEVRALAANQIARLEQAMVDQRRWSFAEFRRLLVEHPLVWHIVRRLVWAWFDGEAVTAFRVAEDRSLADVDDQSLVLDDDATVGVAHPVHLGSAVPAWSEVFADYELLQPFPQLGRDVYTLTEVEQQAETLYRFNGVTVPTRTLLGLERRGWQRSRPQDSGIQPWLLRPLPNYWAAVVELEPGIIVGSPDEFPEQRLTGVWIDEQGSGDWQRQAARRFGELDPVTVSELLRDLTEVTRD